MRPFTIATHLVLITLAAGAAIDVGLLPHAGGAVVTHTNILRYSALPDNPQYDSLVIKRAPSGRGAGEGVNPGGIRPASATHHTVATSIHSTSTAVTSHSRDHSTAADPSAMPPPSSSPHTSSEPAPHSTSSPAPAATNGGAGLANVPPNGDDKGPKTSKPAPTHASISSHPPSPSAHPTSTHAVPSHTSLAPPPQHVGQSGTNEHPGARPTTGSGNNNNDNNNHNPTGVDPQHQPVPTGSGTGTGVSTHAGIFLNGVAGAGMYGVPGMYGGDYGGYGGYEGGYMPGYGSPAGALGGVLGAGMASTLTTSSSMMTTTTTTSAVPSAGGSGVPPPPPPVTRRARH